LKEDDDDDTVNYIHIVYKFDAFELRHQNVKASTNENKCEATKILVNIMTAMQVVAILTLAEASLCN
jgi:hypothetical protein